MLPAMSDGDRRSFRAALAPALRDAVKEAARLADPAELEQLGGDLLPAGMLRGMPEAAAEAVAAIAEIPGALTLLRGMAAAAPPPLSTLAAEAAARLGDGPTSVAAGQVGRLVPGRAWELDVGEAVTSILVECRRPGSGQAQVLCFTLEWPLTDGAIKDGFASAPVEASRVEEEFLGPARTNGIEPAEIAPARAVELVAAGASRCAEAGLGPSREALLAATLLLRAAGRADADALLEPLPGLPSLAELADELLPEAPDEGALRAEVDALVADLEAWCDEQELEASLRDRVVYAGGCMADFKAFYCDSRVAAWEPRELEAFLLDFTPRKVGLERDEIAAFPGAVAEVLRFLGETGRLEPDRAGELGALALAAREEFVEAASDPASWGLAKGMATAMAAAGVDLADEDAVQAWLDVFNAQPRDVREQLLPAIAGPPLSPPPRSSRARPKAAKARRTQRRARRRNRRR